MARNRGGLLAQISEDVADHAVPLSSLLQKCIVLGGQSGSEKMRAWARQELNGYAGEDTIPDYRHVPAPLMAMITNKMGYNGSPARVDGSVFAPDVREMLREKQIDLEDAILGEGIGVLEAMAAQGKEAHRLIPSWAAFIAERLNRDHMGVNSRVDEVYWSVSNASIRGLLVRVRTALADLVAELIMLTPQDQDVPDKVAVDQAVRLVVAGERPVINYTVQHAADGGSNVAAGAGPVTMAGEHGTAIGSQTASGANSSVAGTQEASGADASVVAGQAVQAGRDAVTAGQNAAIPGGGDQTVKEGWWARLRKRGAVVAFSTVIGAIAAVAGVVVGIMVAAGWQP